MRGFKDLQASQLSTFAGATSRWGQRIINSVAVQMGWTLFSADVSQAFLRGLSFEEASKRKDEVTRDVQFTVPPGSADILKHLPGFEDSMHLPRCFGCYVGASALMTPHDSGTSCCEKC